MPCVYTTPAGERCSWFPKPRERPFVNCVFYDLPITSYQNSDKCRRPSVLDD
jgi:hypothetical protein